MKQKILNFISRFHFVLIIEVKAAPAPEPTVLELTANQPSIPEIGTRERITYFTSVRNDAIENLDSARTGYKEAKSARALAAKASA